MAAMLRSYTRGLQLQENFVDRCFNKIREKKELPGYQDAIQLLPIHTSESSSRKSRTATGPMGLSAHLTNISTLNPKLCNIKLGRDILDLPVQPELFLQSIG